MKKRSIIACIITFIILLLTNNFWLHSKPVDLKFDISGNGSVEIEAQLSNKFTKSSTVKKTVNIHELSHVKLKIDDIKTFSNLKIVVNSAFMEGNRLKVENTRLQRGKYKPDASKIKIENNSAGNIITYTYPVKGRASMSFEFEIFVIILVLGYLLSYKLIDYLADFKTIKEKSRLEILFLTLFFILLFIPMSHIDNVSTVSKAENRTLAKWSPLILKDNKINYNFGKDFDSWYSDRFLLREQIIRTFSSFKYNIAVNYFENSKGFVNKRNHWISDKYGLSDMLVSQKDKDLTVYNINKLKEFCSKHGIKFYIIIAPRKEEICNEELYPILKNVSRYKQTKEIIDYVKEKTGVEIVYPYKELEELQKTDTAYFKTDHHWTDEAAYIAYLQVMEQVKKDFPNIKISSNDDFNYKYTKKVKVAPYRGYFEGITYEKVNVSDKNLLDRKYKYFYHKTFDCMKYKSEDHSKNQYVVFDYKNDVDAPNVVLFGDSFTLNLLPSLATSFKDTMNIYTYRIDNNAKKAFKIKRFEEYILRNKPNALVITLSGISRLLYMFDKK